MEGTTPMNIANTGDNLVITISRSLVDIEEVQQFLDYLRYRILVSKSQATAEDVERLTDEINEALALRHAKNAAKE